MKKKTMTLTLRDLAPEDEYCLVLQQHGPRRWIEIVASGAHDAESRSLRTECVKGSVLLETEWMLLGEVLRLTTGEQFLVEAHGGWVTEQEYAAVRKLGWESEEVPWAFGVRPTLPPR